MPSFTIQSRSGKTLIDSLDVSPKDPKKPKSITVDDLKSAISKSLPKYYPSRQRLTVSGNVALEDNNLLSKYNLQSGGTVVLKDLGPQVSWKTVFLVEYFGPLWIHPLFYFFGDVFYNHSLLGGSGSSTTTTSTSTTPFYQTHNIVQQVSFILIMLHFLKREYETLFVHRFSHATMPLLNLFKNSFHYWILSGVNIAFWIYHPNFKTQNGGYIVGDINNLMSTMFKSSGMLSSFMKQYGLSLADIQVYALYGLIGLWTYAELSNLLTHYTLRNLRPPGTRIRKIPFGYGFNLVSCPNYFFETVAWIAISALTGSVGAWVFTIVAFGQMFAWAVKKHRAYKKEFGEKYPKGRKVMIPFVV